MCRRKNTFSSRTGGEGGDAASVPLTPRGHCDPGISAGPSLAPGRAGAGEQRGVPGAWAGWGGLQEFHNPHEEPFSPSLSFFFLLPFLLEF